MNKVVPIRTTYYRVIVRVIMDGCAYYHYTYGEDQGARTIFSLKEIKETFAIREPAAWKFGALESLLEAQQALERKLAERGPELRFERIGFLVTVRPNSYADPISTDPFYPL